MCIWAEPWDVLANTMQSQVSMCVCFINCCASSLYFHRTCQFMHARALKHLHHHSIMAQLSKRNLRYSWAENIYTASGHDGKEYSIRKKGKHWRLFQYQGCSAVGHTHCIQLGPCSDERAQISKGTSKRAYEHKLTLMHAVQQANQTLL